MKNYNSKLKIPIVILSIFLGLFCFAKISQAATYYVSTSGNDSNAGTSASPWRTIQKAANTVVAGDAVIVNAGTYSEAVTIARSGTSASEMIYFKASGTVNSSNFTLSGNYIKLEGFTLAATGNSWQGTIQINGIGDVIESCTIQNSSRQGIVFGPSSNGGTVNNCTITNAKYTGISVDGQNHTITNNDISHIGVNTYLTDDANGMNIESGGTSLCGGHVVRGNYIHDILFTDYPSNNPHIDAVQSNYFGAYCSNVIFERNHIYIWQEAKSGVASSYGFMLSGSNNWTIKNNIIEAWGGMNTGSSGTPQALKFYNNIFRSDINWLNRYWGFGIALSGGSGHEIYNNIFVNFGKPSRDGYMISVSGTSVAGDYNIFWNEGGVAMQFSGYAPAAHDKQAVDPKFVSNFTNLHYQSISPAINAGITVSSVTNDYDGVSRPQGSAYDIGAYEYVGGNDTQAPTVPANLSATAISSTQINLFWTASTDNVAVTGYRVERCQGSDCTPSTQLTTVTATSYSDTGLTALTVYVYRVAAYDAAGNVSGQSSSASATTQSPPDTTPPAPPSGVTVI